MRDSPAGKKIQRYFGKTKRHEKNFFRRKNVTRPDLFHPTPQQASGCTGTPAAGKPLHRTKPGVPGFYSTHTPLTAPAGNTPLRPQSYYTVT